MKHLSIRLIEAENRERNQVLRFNFQCVFFVELNVEFFILVYSLSGTYETIALDVRGGDFRILGALILKINYKLVFCLQHFSRKPLVHSSPLHLLVILLIDQVCVVLKLRVFFLSLHS